MITEDFANFEISKLLKQKGFDIICDYAYNNKGGYFEVDRSNFDEVYCFRPSLALAMKWFRERFNIHITVAPAVENGEFTGLWHCYVDNLKGSWPFSQFIKDASTYEQGCNFVIKYCLENLI